MLLKKNLILKITLFAALIAIVATACSGDDGVEPTPVNNDIQLTSLAFSEGGRIPVQYTCDGNNISPSLRWRGVPNGTERFALIVDDPDAPNRTFVHWVVYGIPGDIREFADGAPPLASIQGANNLGNRAYGGPCPPAGGPHRYFFKIYALDEALELDPGLTKSELLDAMKGHILAQGQLTGTYQRQ